MILEHPIPPFLEWIPSAALNWALAVLALAALAFIVCFVLLLVFKDGPVGRLERSRVLFLETLRRNGAARDSRVNPQEGRRSLRRLSYSAHVCRLVPRS